jgi:citrate lyase beta subunit
MKTSFSSVNTDKIQNLLRHANAGVNAIYPGDSTLRQPVHTVYGGAHLFKSDSAPKMGGLAVQSLKMNAPDATSLAEALGISGTAEFAEKIYKRVEEKLRSEAVEDFRIDFEDGYGSRTDEEEDRHAELAAAEVAIGLAAGTLPPFIGIRIKPLSDELFARSSRTLDIFVSTLLEKSHGHLPANFVVTLPKITAPEQVSALVQLFEILESALALPARSLKLELMIETTQSLFNQKGEAALPYFIAASEGRCVGAHFGAYDYTAACNITAAHQQLKHPACDFARHIMQVTLAGTGISISDGATNIMPVGPHRVKEGVPLTAAQRKENQRVVHRAWKLGYENIRHSLVNAYYQGWDLHPAQLPIRYAAVYSFFLESLEGASLRLKSFMEKAAQANLVGDVFDDAATGQGLLNFFLRGISCGAITEEETQMTGLTLNEIRSRSFYKILKSRKGRY